MTADKYERMRSAFTGIMEDLVKFRGTEPIIARIFAMVVLSPKPLTQEEISNITGYSRSQISRYLTNLEQRGMITKESTPGSRTQLYGGRTLPFFDEFKRSMDISEMFLRGKLEVIELILSEWKDLPEKVKDSDGGKRLLEVVTVFEAWFSTYLDLLMDFNKRFNERMKELERELFQMRTI
ncbi:MAG: MarR family transcriptional regulator [Candidatus Thorarchaeota archaeon]